VARDETVELIAETRKALDREETWNADYTVLTDRRLLLLTGSRRRAQVRDFPVQSISVAESEWGGYHGRRERRAVAHRSTERP
jgi:hypothetical protein